MIPHAIWAGVVLAIAALVVIERRRGRLSVSREAEIQKRIDGIWTALRPEQGATESLQKQCDALRKDVESLKAERQREGLQKLRGG